MNFDIESDCIPEEAKNVCREVERIRPDIAAISDPKQRMQEALCYYLEQFCDNPQGFDKHFVSSTNGSNESDSTWKKEMAKSTGRESEILKLPIEDAVWTIDELFNLPDTDGSDARHLRIMSNHDEWITYNLADPSETTFAEQAYDLVCQGILYPKVKMPRRPLYVTYTDPIQAQQEPVDLSPIGVTFIGGGFGDSASYVRFWSCCACGMQGSRDMFRKCSSCQAVFYCSKDCQKKDWGFKKKTGGHKFWCKKMKIYMQRETELRNLPFSYSNETTSQDFDKKKYQEFLNSFGVYKKGLWKRERVINCDIENDMQFGKLSLEDVEENPYVLTKESQILSKDPCAKPSDVKAWQSYYSYRGFDMNSPIAILLHYPLTLYHIIHNLLPQSCETFHYDDVEEINVDIIGVEKEVEMIPLFQETSRLSPNKKLNIRMFGVDIAKTVDGLEKIYGNLKCSVHRSFYHNYSTDITPHVAVGLTASSITVPQYAVLYNESLKYRKSYEQLELALKSICPDFETPKKWSNVTRSVFTNIENGKNLFQCVFGNNKSVSIGFHCDKIGLHESDLTSGDLHCAFTVGAFKELCHYKSKISKSWHDVSHWISRIIPPSRLNLTEGKIIYYFQKVNVRSNFLSKRRKTSELEAFLGMDFASFVKSKSKGTKKSPLKKDTNKSVIKVLSENIQLKKEIISLENKTDTLEDVIAENRQTILDNNKTLSDYNKILGENKSLKSDMNSKIKELKGIKKENFYKRLKRREQNLNRKQDRLSKKMECKENELSVSADKIRCLEKKISALELSKSSYKKSLHLKSNQINYLQNAYTKSQFDKSQLKVQLDNKVQENIVLMKQNLELTDPQSPNIHTKTNRFSDDMRSCVLELSALDIPCNKVPGVIKAVGNNIFQKQIQTPSKTTVQNIISEGNVISHQQVGKEILKVKNWGLFSDGTSRDGRKIIDVGIHTDNNSYSLGYRTVAIEDAETVSHVLRDSLSYTANCLENENSKEQNINKFLLSLNTIMSDRSSVMKKTNVILDEWRTLHLQTNMPSTDVNNLEFLYCSAHVLLGFHSQIEKDIKSYHKALKLSVGRDNNPKFSSFKNSNEAPSFRLIRTVSECFGPCGDEKNGARQHWLSYLGLKKKKSYIFSYRSNRFNNLFEGAKAIVYHKEDLLDFLNNYLENPNLKLQSICLDLNCDILYKEILCLAALGTYVTIPFWNLVNSNEHYMDLFKYFQPLHDKLKVWAEDCSEIFMGEIDPVFPKFPHTIDEQFNLLLTELQHNNSAKDIFSLMSKSLLLVNERQLKDHLGTGKYSYAPTEQVRASTSHAKLTNIPAENLFGDLDYAMKRKRNATMFHLLSC